MLAFACAWLAHRRGATAGLRTFGIALAIVLAAVAFSYADMRFTQAGWKCCASVPCTSATALHFLPSYVQQLEGDRTCRLYEAGIGHSRATFLHIDGQVVPGIKQLISVQDLGSCDGGCRIDGASACGAIP
jgi:hypothetical protein